MNAAQLVADEWEVHSIPQHGEVVRLVRKWHYSHSAPNTSTYRHGLYRGGVVLHGCAHGCALWIPPTKGAALTVDPDWEGVLSLSRFVIDPDLPSNAASFLLAASMRLIDRRRWPTLLTYADTAQSHTGTIYKATNWQSLGEVPAGDTWHNEAGEQRGRKRGGRTLRVAEMVAQGFTRDTAAPKIKFVHRTKRARRLFS